MYNYTPLDWYWIRANDVYSSRRNTYVPLDDAEYLSWLDEGGYATPHPSDAELVDALAPYGIVPVVQDHLLTQRRLEAAVQSWMDGIAQAQGYDSILSACTYATDTHPPFSADGQAAVAWRGQVWRNCYQILGECQAGNRSVPTASELIAMLPPIVWPPRA